MTTEVISFRLQGDEHAQLESLAEELDLRISALVREIVRAHLRATVAMSSVGITAGVASITARTTSLPGSTTAAPLTHVPDYPPELVAMT